MTCVINGRRRQGKSTLAYWLSLRSQQDSGSRSVLVFDPNSQYRNLPRAESIEEIPERLSTDGMIAYRPEVKAIQDDFQEVADILWPYGNYSLVVDEATCLQSFAYMHPALENLMRRAPRELPDRVSLIMTVHRTIDSHRLVRELCTDWFWFQTALKDDLNTVEKQFGPEAAQEIATLGQYQFVHCWLDAGGTIKHESWRDPREWYIDISGTHSAGGNGDARGHLRGFGRELGQQER